jgi:hypothetical protein
MINKQAGTKTSGQMLFWPGILTRRLILTGVNSTSSTAEVAELILSKSAGKRKENSEGPGTRGLLYCSRGILTSPGEHAK